MMHSCTKRNASGYFVIRLLSAVVVLFLGVCDCHAFIACDHKWYPLGKTTQYSFREISRLSDRSIIGETVTATSRRRCAFSCSMEGFRSLYYLKATQTCHCNLDWDFNLHSVKGNGGIIYGAADYWEVFQNGPVVQVQLSPPGRDCLELYQKGYKIDGVYTIRLVGGATMDTWCDMTNGGWTVFQRRQDGSESFLRGWEDYASGFGNICGEYWLGLDNIHLLTKDESELFISLETFGDILPTSAYARYRKFSVGDMSSKYTLSVGEFEGDCGDDMSVHSGMNFSTIDNDNDEFWLNCAEMYKGAWWYSFCHFSNLNGLYLGGAHDSFGNGINWQTCWGYKYSLKQSVMKARRIV